MGMDVAWVNPPLGGRIGKSERDAALEWANVGDRAPLEISTAIIFRVSEGLGDYFRASTRSWSVILSEMTTRGVFGEIPEARTTRVEGYGEVPFAEPADWVWKQGETITPAQITEALAIIEQDPILPLQVSEVLGDMPMLPGLWVRWLCFMERAAVLGGGFHID